MFNKKYVYVVCGRWPNISIDKKEYIYKDEYCYCVRELNSNNISLISKEQCFTSHCEALEYQNKMIQQVCNKIIEELNLEISNTFIKK